MGATFEAQERDPSIAHPVDQETVPYAEYIYNNIINIQCAILDSILNSKLKPFPAISQSFGVV